MVVTFNSIALKKRFLFNCGVIEILIKILEIIFLSRRLAYTGVLQEFYMTPS